MPQTNKIITNFVGGELSPNLYGRIDLPLFQKGLAKCENFVALPSGGARYRNGTALVNYTAGNKYARLIPFQFSDQQAYVLELTNLKMRFFKDNAAITETPKNISGVTGADPGGTGMPFGLTLALTNTSANFVPNTVTSPAHGFSNGDTVYITGVQGPVQINGRFYVVANATTNTFTLQNVFGIDISVFGLAPYVTGGTVARVYEIATPWVEADIDDVQFAQNADTMYMVHRSYPPRKLTRTAHTSWSCALYARSGPDPFGTVDNYPGAVTFTDSGRLLMGGTNNKPETIWGSVSPTAGVTAFDNFTPGTFPTSGFVFTLAPIFGKPDTIQYLSNTPKVLIAGGFGSNRVIYGNTPGEAVTPIAITAKAANSVGSARIMPVNTGDALFFVQRGGQILRNLEFDYLQDGYTTPDRNLVTEHLTASADYKSLMNQRGNPEIMWAVRKDGRLLALTYINKEDISGWHRHYLGGSSVGSDGKITAAAKVLSLAPMPRDSGKDQLWCAVERYIGGRSVRTVEYMTDAPVYPVEHDYYTGSENEASDKEWYSNVLYEIQKGACHLDMSSALDTSATTAISFDFIADNDAAFAAWGG